MYSSQSMKVLPSKITITEKGVTLQKEIAHDVY